MSEVRASMSHIYFLATSTNALTDNAQQLCRAQRQLAVRKKLEVSILEAHDCCPRRFIFVGGQLLIGVEVSNQSAAVDTIEESHGIKVFD